jgi:hypothetical protein
MHLLKQRRPVASEEWVKRLPDMAKKLEEELFNSARSLVCVLHLPHDLALVFSQKCSSF